jgi:hypothetical protein
MLDIDTLHVCVVISSHRTLFRTRLFFSRRDYLHAARRLWNRGIEEGDGNRTLLQLCVLPSLQLRRDCTSYGTVTRILQTEVAPKAAGGERSFLDDIKKVCRLV